MRAKVALVGDRDPSITAHRAIPVALRLAGRSLTHVTEPVWVPTDTVDPDAPGEVLETFDGLWCVPASPYRSMEGPIAAIAYARTNGLPFLGTCGGFQHALIEIGRNLAGLEGVGHAEVEAAGEHLIAPLSCALVESLDRVRLVPGSRTARAYRSSVSYEEYLCSYGLNDAYREVLEGVGVRMVGFDDAGEVRAFELPTHPFFIGTLFQPERAALRGEVPPLVRAFVDATTRSIRPMGGSRR